MAIRPLGECEQIVLLGILRVGEAAYGVTIRAEIRNRTRRDISPGALYTTLDRLEHKGLLRSHFGDPTPERGGRAKRFFTVTPAGRDAVRHAQDDFHRLLEGLDLLGESHA
jgi:PadR family transcriptional regulator PadR